MNKKMMNQIKFLYFALISVEVWTFKSMDLNQDWKLLNKLLLMKLIE